VIRWPGLGDVYARPNSAATIGSITDAVGTFFIKVQGLFAAQTNQVASLEKGTQF
jgi:hypothetical protein